MRVDRSRPTHRITALVAGLGFASMALGIVLQFHLDLHEAGHHSDRCSTCVTLTGQVRQIDPGTAPQAGSGQGCT